MTAEQIMGMKADDLLLLVGNRSPLKANQNLYFKNKGYLGRYLTSAPFAAVNEH